MQIENHSWDHNHPVLARSVQRDNVRGRFDVIETEAEAEAEIARASDYIAAQTGMRPVYFAYPFGQTNDFLATDYLPRRGAAIGLRAAFTTDPRPLNDDDSRWLLPRYVCGRDWCDDLGLERLITAP
jgi:peptidoglycan/xylan/chitin deacetylase (PgdA/CDA1 family)